MLHSYIAHISKLTERKGHRNNNWVIVGVLRPSNIKDHILGAEAESVDEGSRVREIVGFEPMVDSNHCV